MNDGRKLTGTYGTWRGSEIEMRSNRPWEGEYSLVQEGGERPGPEWRAISHPGGIGTTPYRYYLEVPEAEVTDVHSIEVTGFVRFSSPGDRDALAPVQVQAQDATDRLWVRCFWDSRTHWHDLKQEFGFEELERESVHGWLPGERVADLRFERSDYTPG